MPIRTSLNVSLTPELEKFVQSRVASGQYQTASEVIREGLRLLEEREQTREAALLRNCVPNFDAGLNRPTAASSSMGIPYSRRSGN